MPLALIALGALLILSAIKGTEHDLGSQLQADFTGQGSFLYWIASLVLLGALGMVPVLRAPSRWLIGLVLVAMIFSNKGVFAQLLSAVQSPAAAKSQALPTSSSGNSVLGSSGGSSSGGSSDSTGQILQYAEIAAMFL